MKLLLLTGATGFLGGAVLDKLLDSCNNINLLLLVRAPTPQAGLERIKEDMRKFNVCERRLHALTNDNTLPEGLNSPEAFLMDPHLDEVTHVINCAAITSFGNSPFIWNMNVTGTLIFTRRTARVVGLRRFLCVGTAMSCTPYTGSLVKKESASSETDEHLVEYTHSKATIEYLVRKRCPDLPLLVARPSIIVDHSRLGRLSSTSIFQVFRIGLMLQKFMCSLSDKIDVIPVDYCADALLILLGNSLINGEIVHISAGEESSVTFFVIDEVVARTLNCDPVGDRYTRVSYNILTMSCHDFESVFGPRNEHLILETIRLHGVFNVFNICFSNGKLLSVEVPKPPKFTDYIRYYIETTEHLSIQQ